MNQKENQDSGLQERDFAVLIRIMFVVVFWGLTVVTAKHLTFSTHPYTLATLRLLLSASILLPVAYPKYGYSITVFR